MTNLLLVHHIATPHFLSPSLRGLDAFVGPLSNNLPLKFGQGSEDVTDQASGGRAGFNTLGNGLELDPPTGEVIEDGDEATK